MEYDQSSKDLESSRFWGRNFDSSKETNNRSPRVSSDSLQHWGSNDKESRRCYRCHEVGHVAARCKNMSSSRPWEWESSRGPAKTMAGRQSNPESPWGLRTNKEEGSLKENSSWKSHGADSSGTCSLNTSQQMKNPGKERLGRINTVNSNKEEGSVKESLSWKSHGADSSGTCSELSSLRTKNSGKERLCRTDTVNIAVKLSHKSSENALVLERQVAQVQVLDGQKGNVATSSSPSMSFETGKQVSIQSFATSQQAQGVDAVMDKHSQEPQPNQMVLSHVQNRCGSGTLMSTAELDLKVDTSFDSYCEIRADPCVEMLWRYSCFHFPNKMKLSVLLYFSPHLSFVFQFCSGCFSVSSNNCLTTYKGLQAHPSMKADPRIFEAIKTLPFELYMEELKRGLETDTWPRSLQEQPPTSNSIGIYFFPVDMEWLVFFL